MRISQRNVLMTHERTAQTAFKNLTDSNAKLTSGRAFHKSYEDPSAAARALRVRQQMRDDAIQKSNIEEAHGRLNSADSHMQELLDMMNTALKDKLTQACNGVYSPAEREKIAVEIEEYQKEVLAMSNAQYAQKFLFGAAGGNNRAPFKVNGEGKLTYQTDEYVVDELRYNKETGTVQYEKEFTLSTGDKFKAWVDIEYDRTNYIDIGLGFEVHDADTAAFLDPETALPYTLSGAKVFGVGTTEVFENGPNAQREVTKISNNLYGYLGDIAKALRDNDMDMLDKQLTHFTTVQNNLLVTEAEIGARFNFADDMKTVLTNDEYNMSEKQKNLESIDIAKEAKMNKLHDMAWMATLQLGSRILPTSLFDFMR